MLKAGLIGCGYISEKHIRTLAKLSNVKLVAVSDLQKEAMKNAVKNYQLLKQNQSAIAQYTDYHDMLCDIGIDFVIVAAYSGMHAAIVKEALKNHKHVLVEKPLALSLADADEIIQISEMLNKQVLVCHQLRYLPIISKLKQVIEKKQLGNLHFASISMRINRSDDYFANSTWKGTWKKDGGMLINQGIHLIDLFTWLMGNIKEVYGDITRNRKNKEIEDVAAGIVTFSNQAKGLIEANTITKPANLGYQLNIFAEKGTISIGGKGLQEIIHCYVEQHPELESELQSNATDEHLLMYKDFFEAIQKNRPPLVSAKESRKALETIFALYRSALKKQPVPLPLSAFSTEEMITWSKKGDEYND